MTADDPNNPSTSTPRQRPTSPSDGPPDHQAAAPQSRPSQARVDANRRNAQRSTGPRTPEGKSRSSQNALRHGAYASSTTPIRCGELAEDPDLVAAGVDDIIDSLAPRDAVEHRQARLIASLYLRLDRLERYEALSLEADGRWSIDQRTVLGAEEANFHNYDLTMNIEEAVASGSGGAEEGLASEIYYGDMTSFLRDHIRKDPTLLALRGPRKATPGEDAQAQFRLLVAHFWPDGELEEWLRPLRGRYLHGYLQARGRLAEESAKRALRETFDQSIKLRAMVAAQLVRATMTYDRYQSRWLEETADSEGESISQ